MKLNLYTVLLDFSDFTTGIGQYQCASPTEALQSFIKESQSLEEYSRNVLLEIINERSQHNSLLLHMADKMKWFWIINFGTDLLNDPNLDEIYGGYIIQTDPHGPVRNT